MSKTQPLRILLVSGDLRDASLARDALADPRQFEVEHAPLLADALRRLAESRFDVILADLELPGSTGVDTLRHLRARAPNLPILAMSGRDDDDLAVQALHEGAQDCLLKSQLGESALRRAIRHSIERRRAEAAVVEERERLKGIVDSAMDAILSVDLQQRIVLCNPAAEAMFKVPANELVGRTLDSLMPERHRVRHHDQVWAYGETGASRRHVGDLGSVVGLRSTGEEFPIEVSISRSEVQGVKLLTAIIRDISERIRAERRLRASEQRFRVMAESIEEAVWVSNAEGTELLYLSPAFEKITGRSRESVCRNPASFLDDVHPEDRARVVSMHGAMPGSAELELRIVRADGAIRHLWTRFSRVANASEETDWIVGIVQDVTERSVAFAKLATSEARYRALMENAIVAFSISSLDGVVREVNSCWEKIYGLPRDQVVNKECGEYLPSEVAHQRTLEFRQIVANGRGEAHDVEIRRPDGSVRYVDIASSVVPVEDGQVVLAIGRDVTLRHLAKESLRLQESRFRALIEKSDDGIVLIDREGAVVYMSPSAKRIVGHPHEERLVKNVLAIAHPDDRALVVTTMTELLAKPSESRTIQFRILHPDGICRWIEGTGTNLLEDPAVGAIVGNFHDITARKLADDRLRASEERYRRILETTNEGVWFTDLEGNTTFVNERMARMLGVRPDDLLGRSPAELLTGEGLAAFNEYLEGGGCDQVELSYERRDGTISWGLLEASPMLDDAGRQEGCVAMVMDITERRKAESARRISEARFKRLWDSGIVLIAISDAAGRIVEMNEAGLKMLGYSSQELLSGRVTWSEITPPEWRAIDEKSRAQLIATGSALPWEKELIRKDGSRVPILAGAAILEGSEGVAIAIDLTARKAAEEELLERMRISALTSDVAVALNDGNAMQPILQRCAEAVVRHLNVAFARLWTSDVKKTVLELQASAGIYDHRDATHRRVLIGQGDIGRIAELREAQFTNDISKEPLICDAEWAKSNGLVAFAGYPLLVGGEIVGVMDVFARQPLGDVALKGLGAVADSIALGIQRKTVEGANDLLESQLRQAQKMEAVGRLAGGVAHDFNNQLSVILSYADIMLADLAPQDPMREDLTEVCKAARRAADLTRQLLMFSRQQVVEPKIIDLRSLLASMEKMLRRVLGEDIELALKADAQVGSVMADPGSIEQVIMNLVVNARDAMSAGGQLTIELADVILDDEYAAARVGVKPGRYVVLGVSDTGIGMDEATQGRIFEPFFTTKEVGKGTGLGLSTVFGIVEQSGGHIAVRSEPRAGTTFNIHLPCVEGSAPSARPRATPGLLRGAETVLLVEDEAPVRAVAREILQRSGYRVLEASNAGEALLLCEQHRGKIDLLLSDVVMPKMSGPALAKRLVEIRPAMKVLCMSGYTDDSIVQHGVLEGRFAFLQKPITPATLTRKVRDVLDARTSAQSAAVGM